MRERHLLERLWIESCVEELISGEWKWEEDGIYIVAPSGTFSSLRHQFPELSLTGEIIRIPYDSRLADLLLDFLREDSHERV